MNDHASPQISAVRTVGGVLTDLVEIAERLPVRADQAEQTARILDRLSGEIAEAAGMVRSVSRAGPGLRAFEARRGGVLVQAATLAELEQRISEAEAAWPS